MLLRLLPYIIKTLIAAIFAFSAITKLISIDYFELYIYGFEWFSFSLSSIIARLIVSFELGIAAMLVVNIYHRWVWLITMGTIIAFSAFLLVMHFSGETGNCNCFGELIKLNPINSFYKNIFILVLLILCYKVKPFIVNRQKIILASLAIVCIVIVNIISPPDFLVKYSKKQNNLFEIESFVNISTNKKTQFDLNSLESGKKVIAFFSPKCKFCKLAAKKLNVIREKSKAKNKILYVFYGEEKDVTNFFLDAEIMDVDYIIIHVDDFFKHSSGSLPEILTLKEGSVVKTYGFRTIDEKELLNYLK